MKMVKEQSSQSDRAARRARAFARVFNADEKIFRRVLETEADERKKAIGEMLDLVVKAIRQGDA